MRDFILKLIFNRKTFIKFLLYLILFIIFYQYKLLWILGIFTGIMIMFFSWFFTKAWFDWSNPERKGGPKFYVKGVENKAIHVMKGNKFTGKVILPSSTTYVAKDYSLNNIEHFAPHHDPDLIPKEVAGLYWIGLWPFYSIKLRRQQWMEWESTADGRRIRFRDEMTPYLIIKPFEYAMFLEEAEDFNGVPLNITFTVILNPIDAVKPIFSIDDAYGQIQTLCLGEALIYVKGLTFADLGKGESKGISKETQDNFSKKICELNKLIPGREKIIVNGAEKDPNVEDCYGYRILDAKLNTVELGGELKTQLLEASTAEYIAEQKKKAKIQESEGDLVVAQNEALGMEAKLKVQSDYLKKISTIPGAMKVEERKATPGIQTLVEGENKTGIIIGGK